MRGFLEGNEGCVRLIFFRRCGVGAMLKTGNLGSGDRGLVARAHDMYHQGRDGMDGPCCVQVLLVCVLYLSFELHFISRASSWIKRC